MRNHAAPFWRKKYDSLRHSTTGFRENVLVAEDTLTKLMLKVLSSCDREGKGLLKQAFKRNKSTNFSGEKILTMKLYRVSIFCEYAKS